MLENIMKQIIDLLASCISGNATLMIADHAERQAKLAVYRQRAQDHVREVGTTIAGETKAALRNDYREWLDHPRLGHEALSAELRAAELAVNEVALDLRTTPSLLNQLRMGAACLRVLAITEVLGEACISKTPRRSAAAKKGGRAKKGNDKRMNRRAPVIEDIPTALRPLLAGLHSNNPGRAAVLDEIGALCGSDHDQAGIITKIVTLAGLEDGRAVIDALAVAARPAEHVRLEEDIKAISSDDSSDTAIPTVQAPPAAHPPVLVEGRADADAATMRDIMTVRTFCERSRWAVIELGNNRMGLKSLAKRKDVEAAFARVSDHPDMQAALRTMLAR